MGKIIVIKDADFSEVKVAQVVISNVESEIICEGSPVSGGTVTGGGTYMQGDTATLTAVPSQGFLFSHWSDGNTSTTRQVTVGSSSVTYTAYFAHTLEVTFDEIPGWYDSGAMMSGSQTPINTVSIVQIPTGATSLHLVGSLEKKSTFVFLSSLPSIPTVRGEEVDVCEGNADLSGWTGAGDVVIMSAMGAEANYNIPDDAVCVLFNCQFSADVTGKPQSGIFNA